MSRLQGIFIMDHSARELVYGPGEMRGLERHVEFPHAPHDRASIGNNPSVLNDVDVIFSGWGAPLLSHGFLDHGPKLKAFFYGAGSIGHCLTDAVWRRGIQITTAVHANSQPVAEYTLSTILFSLKHGWRLARETRIQRKFVERNDVPSCFRSVVGLVSLGTIGRLVLKLLRQFDMQILVYDPYLSIAEASALGVEKVSLEELFSRSDVVSLHTPVLPETRGFITGELIDSMKPGATLINTARGEIIRQDQMIEVAIARPDLQFVLDVVTPEPPAADSPLYDLANVVMTPHIAGSAGPECRRMGQFMVEELERYVAGEPLKWAVNPPEHFTTEHLAMEQRSVTVTTFVSPKKSASPMPIRQGV